MIEVPISPGELLDKITILEIKLERIADDRVLGPVRRELSSLASARAQAVPSTPEIEAIEAALKGANETLWELEDGIRACEREQVFGPHFVELARSIYRTNDHRAALKRRVNDLLASAISEVKSYAAY